jgi:hypothetical protein
MTKEKKQQEFEEIAKIYCLKFGYTYVFANIDNGKIGFMYDGQFYTHSIEEMIRRLKEAS